MKMISLEQSMAEKYGSPEGGKECPKICLTGDQIKELGLEAVPVGSMLTMTANVCLCERHEDDERGMRIEIEIEEAGFSMKEKPKSAASIIYPDD